MERFSGLRNSSFNISSGVVGFLFIEIINAPPLSATYVLRPNSQELMSLFVNVEVTHTVGDVDLSDPSKKVTEEKVRAKLECFASG